MSLSAIWEIHLKVDNFFNPNRLIFESDYPAQMKSASYNLLNSLNSLLQSLRINSQSAVKVIVRNILLFVLSLMLLSSCNQEFFKVIPAKNAVVDSTPTHLRLTGAASILANTCAAYTVARLNSSNALAAASFMTAVTLNPKTNGSFHLLSDCSDGAITNVVIDAGASSKIVYYTNTAPGIYDLLASGLGTPNSILVTIASDIPEFSFEQESFTLTEANSAVGNVLNIKRSIPGASQSVTITGTDITNYPGEVTLSAQVINFGPADTVKTVTFPFPGPTTDFKGDRFFKVKLSTPTNAAVISTIDEAVVNILESQIPAKFFFPQTLYSVRESAGTVSIRIQRVGGDPALPETVNLTTLNGSAVTPTHFLSGGPQTITFNPGETEKSATISIIDNVIEGDSKSFFIELKNPNSGTDLITRPWSTAKVRIVDNDETAVCDSSITGAFGGGLGTAIDPFFICSVDQLNQIASDADKFYKIMSDLDLQGFTQIAANFIGSLNGNEKVLKNYRSAGAGKRGMFLSMGDNGPNTISIKNVNLMQAYVNSSDDYASGLVVEAWNNYHTLSGNLVSGLIYSPSEAGGILGKTIALHDIADSYNLAHGTVYGNRAGGLIGYSPNTDTPTIWLDHSYSTANVFGSGTIGGLFGNYDYAHGKLHISNSHAKGYITGTGSAADADHYGGGLIGGIVAQTGSDISVTNSFYEGGISKTTRSGGLIGKASTFDGAESYSAIYTGNRVQASIEARGNAGGLIGDISTDVNMILSNNELSVRITEDTSVLTSGEYIAVGGVVGYINSYGSPSLTVSNMSLTNKNSITAVTNGNKGGLFGGMSLYGYTDIMFSALDYYGTISAPNTMGLGGIVGSVRGIASHAVQLTMTDAHFFGSITGRRSVGGIIGGIENQAAFMASPSLMSISNVSSLGDITATEREAGGILGYNYQEDYTSLLITNAFSSGSISGDNKIGGIIGASQIAGGINSNTTIELSSARGSLHGSTTGATFMGGLVGIFNCHDAGSILIDRSYNKATLNSTGEDVGGLVDGMEIQNGSCKAEIRNSYSSGTIDASQYTTGLVAYYKFEYANGGDFKITNSYSSSLILNTGGTGMDGLTHAWTPTDTVTITNSFFAQDPGHNAALPVQSYSMATVDFQLLPAAPYNWNFATIWEFKAGAQYPTLRQNPEP